MATFFRILTLFALAPDHKRPEHRYALPHLPHPLLPPDGAFHSRPPPCGIHIFTMQMWRGFAGFTERSSSPRTWR